MPTRSSSSRPACARSCSSADAPRCGAIGEHLLVAQGLLRRGEGVQAPASKWRLAFPIAAAAAVGALAIGVQLRSLPPTTHAPVVAVAQPASSSATTRGDDPVIASTLEENPDLYVWLASDDAALMAME